MTRARRLLPISLAYLPVPIAGAVLSARWGVGATADRDPSDMALRGTALTPPLFLPLALVAGAASARSRGPRRARAGSGVAAAVGCLFLAGSTANLPNDLAAARAAGSPVGLTSILAAGHLALALTLLWHAVPGLRGR